MLHRSTSIHTVHAYTRMVFLSECMFTIEHTTALADKQHLREYLLPWETAVVCCEDILFLKGLKSMLFMRMWLWAFCNHQASLLNKVKPKKTVLGRSLDMNYRAPRSAWLLDHPHCSHPTPEGSRSIWDPLDYSISDVVATALCCNLG